MIDHAVRQQTDQSLGTVENKEACAEALKQVSQTLEQEGQAMVTDLLV